MFITKKNHNKIVCELKEKIACLEKQVELKAILERLLDKVSFTTDNNLRFSDGNLSLLLPDNVAQYEDDFFGGKVIKQEATKVIKILKDGSIETGITRKSPDKGYPYKLVREKN